MVSRFTHSQTHTVYMRLKGNEEFKTEWILTEHTNTKERVEALSLWRSTPADAEPRACSFVVYKQIYLRCLPFPQEYTWQSALQRCWHYFLSCWSESKIQFVLGRLYTCIFLHIYVRSSKLSSFTSWSNLGTKHILVDFICVLNHSK